MYIFYHFVEEIIIFRNPSEGHQLVRYFPALSGEEQNAALLGFLCGFFFFFLHLVMVSSPGPGISNELAALGS